MAINLARMGSIPSPSGADYNPFAEGAVRRRAAQLERQGTLDLQKGMLDLATAKRAEKAAIDLARDQAKEKQIMGKYVQGRDAAENLPLGVVNPRFIEDSGMGPQPMVPKRTAAPVERETILDLARVNPATAESFRLGRQAETQGTEDRTRKMAFEDANQKRLDEAEARAGRKLTNEEKQQIVANNLAWFQANTGRINANKPPAAAVKPATADQNTYANYGRRLTQAEQDLKTLEQSGFDRSKPAMGLFNKLPTMFQPAPLQQQKQAERNFVNAVLRRESGAVISPSEFENAEKQYFPRTGDSPEVKAQKARNRQLVIESFKNLSGPAWEGAGGSPEIPDAVSTLSQEDQDALEWANMNPNDPRAKQIKQNLGVE